MVKPSDCRRCKLVADRSMALTLACESESMMRTFLRNTAESVSASESTSVDLPTPPLVFMTAMVLRMPHHHPSRVPLVERTCLALGWCDRQMWQTADARYKNHAEFQVNASHRAPSPTPPMRALARPVRGGRADGAPLRVRPRIGFPLHHVPSHVVILSVGLHIGGGGEPV